MSCTLLQASVAGVTRCMAAVTRPGLFFCYVPVLLPAAWGGEGAFVGITGLYVPRHKEEVSTQVYINVPGR